MSLSDTIKQIIKDSSPALEDATKAVEKAKAELTKVTAEYRAQETVRNHCIMECYKARIAAINKAIDEEIKTMAAPDKFDADRVKYLRDFLAGKFDDKYESGIELRFEKLKCLHELKLTVKKFPLVQRVADVIERWIGKKFDVKESDDGCISLNNHDNSLMVTDRGLYEYYTDTEIYRKREWRNTISRANIFVGDCHRSYDFATHFVEFWELNCLDMALSAVYVLGAPKPQFGLGRDNESMEPLNEYGRILKNIGSIDVLSTYRVKPVEVTPEIIAGLVIAAYPGMFTVSEVFKVWPDLIKPAQDALESMLKKAEKSLNLVKFNRISDLSFDRGTESFIWHDTVDEGDMFDPDTCEMVHTSLVKHSLPMGEVPFSQIAEYALTNLDGVSRYGYVILKYNNQSTWRNDYFTLNDVNTVRGQDILPKKLQEYLEIIDFPTKIEKFNWDPPCRTIQFSAALKIPMEKFHKMYQDRTDDCRKETYKDGDTYYLKDYCVDKHLFKLYLHKEDLEGI